MNDTSRPEIAALGSATLCEAFQVTAAQRPEQVALRTLGGAIEITYAGFLARVRALAEGLHSLGVGRGDTVALMLTNRPEFSLADTAVMHLGATAFSVYNTSSAEQANHLFRNAGNRIVVTERQFLSRVLESRTAEIEHIVLVDGADAGTITLHDLGSRRVPGFDFDSAWRAVQPDDVVTLIYTSGTTGPSKAVQLTHGGVLFQTRGVAAMLGLQTGGRSISYLPSAHVGDRCLTHYGASLCFGNSVTSIPDHRQVGLALVEVRPTVFGGVPRVWEKLKAGLEAAGITDPAALPEQVKAAVRAKSGTRPVRLANHGCGADLARGAAVLRSAGSGTQRRLGHVGVLVLRHAQSARPDPDGHGRQAFARRRDRRSPTTARCWCARRW